MYIKLVKLFISVVGLFYVVKVLTHLMVMTKKFWFRYDFFFTWCKLHLKFEKITSGSPWPRDGRLVTTRLCWTTLTLKAEFSSERPVLFLYICSIYVAATHIARYHILQENGPDEYKKDRTINSAFDIIDQKTVEYLPASYRSVKLNPELIFPKTVTDRSSQILRITAFCTRSFCCTV